MLVQDHGLNSVLYVWCIFAARIEINYLDVPSPSCANVFEGSPHAV
ncbi:MAG: hypothetical protein ACI9FZ_000340 [Bacteroidia bacterium]|jgi:hypothetical protein